MIHTAYYAMMDTLLVSAAALRHVAIEDTRYYVIMSGYADAAITAV